MMLLFRTKDNFKHVDFHSCHDKAEEQQRVRMAQLGVRRNHIESECKNEKPSTPPGNKSNLCILAFSLSR